MSGIVAVRSLLAAGDHQAALSLAREALTADTPPDPELLALVGEILFKSGRRGEAAEIYGKLAQIVPSRAGFFLKIASRLKQAEGDDAGFLRFALPLAELEPDDRELAYAVAEKLMAAGRNAEIRPLVPRLDRRDPRHFRLLSYHYGLLGERSAVSRLLDEALADDPENPMLLVLRAADAGDSCDMALQQRLNPLMIAPPPHRAAAIRAWQHGLWRRMWCDDEAANAEPCLESQWLAENPSGLENRPRRAIAPVGQKLRIGYLSSDFKIHATMTLLLDVLVHHDREAFDIKLLCHTDPAQAARAWPDWPATLRAERVDINGLSDAEASDLIDALNIDILVDLKGHTGEARLGIVNAARAPIKVTWLGFPGTVSGVDLDYAITDRVVTPDAAKPFYREKLCRLPETYQPNSCESRAGPILVSRADYGLPDDAFVFAAFNAPRKIRPERLALWAAILKAVPGSLLWTVAPAGTADNLVEAFSWHGVPAERLVISQSVDYPQFLGRARLCDLGLDTHPYNGHTTTSDMLWAGLPVVATSGKNFAARVSASLLGALGLDELVAADDAAYLALCTGLAADPGRLRMFRDRIEAARFTAPLFDAERLARHLEHGFTLMAERARAGLSPDHIDVPALPARDGPFASREPFVEPLSRQA